MENWKKNIFLKVLAGITIWVFFMILIIKSFETKAVDSERIVQSPILPSSIIHTSSPLIGILTKPLEEYDLETDASEIIEGRYVGFIESGGGRVVPIPYTLEDNEIISLMNKLNGVLFVGGDIDLTEQKYENGNLKTELTPYAAKGELIIKHALELNSQGEWFPIWGTCLGFELLLLVLSEDYDILSECYDCSD
jgi:gamma-glutamyl hydrolase